MHLVYHWLFTPVVLLNESEMLKWAGCQTLPLVAVSAVQPHCRLIKTVAWLSWNPARTRNCDLSLVSYLIIAWALNSSHKTVIKYRPDSFTLKNKASGIKMWVWDIKPWSLYCWGRGGKKKSLQVIDGNCSVALFLIRLFYHKKWLM